MIHEIMGHTTKSMEQYDKVLEKNKDQGLQYGYILIMQATVLPRILPGSIESVHSIHRQFKRNIDSLLPLSKLLSPWKTVLI